VFVEIGFAHAQDVARLLQGGQVRGLIARVLDHEQDLNYGLGGQPWHRGGPDMLDRKRRVAKGRSDPSFLLV
jgi:hypothetical protein